MRYLFAFGAGALFAIGLAVGGMTQPARIIGFLDVAGEWDPTLLFVMAGAVGTSMLGYRLVVGRAHAVFDPQLHMPRSTRVDPWLVGGSVLFGAGWGISGFCPGPAITSLVTGSPTVLIFVLSMVGGVLLFDYGLPLLSALKARGTAAPAPAADG